MTKKEALKKIYNDYDAYYIENSYTKLGEGTHAEEEKLLAKAFENDELGMRALHHIHNTYDCYYKDEYLQKDGSYREGGPFAYLLKEIEKQN